MGQSTIPRSGFGRSFSFAGQGVWHVIRTQRNMRVHLLAALAATAVGLALHIDAADWACILTVIGQGGQGHGGGCGPALFRGRGGRGHRRVPAPVAAGAGLIFDRLTLTRRQASPRSRHSLLGSQQMAISGAGSSLPLLAYPPLP